MSKMRVAITGSAGFIGSNLYKRLQADGIDVVGIDLEHPAPQGGPHVPGDTVTCLSTVDLCCNLGEIESVPKDVFKGCSHVVHLAAQGSADAPMEGESGVMQRNVVATHNVLKLCEQSEVKRVVFASTNHVTHGHFIGNEGPGSIEDNGEKPRVDLRSKTLPDSFYAVSKVFGEELCKYYALVKRKFSAVCLRVGWCLYDDPSVLKGSPHEAYLRSMFVSKAFVRALNLDNIKEPYTVAYVLSNNSSTTINMEESIKILGYQPVDSSDTFFD